MLTTDASCTAIGYVLSQKDEHNRERPISYGGRALRLSEKNYSISEIEALALVEGIRHYHTFLAGQKFDVYTDHISLKWLKNIKQSKITSLLLPNIES